MPQEPSFGPFWSESAGEAGAVSNFCEYARLDLAAWRAKPEVHRQFDDWLFAAMKPPSLNEAEIMPCPDGRGQTEIFPRGSVGRAANPDRLQDSSRQLAGG